jgi:DNA invertase Pin-like site-specific DNA recombinase
MRAVFAQWQREELAAKMAAFAQARQTRREMWSRIPFGFRLGRDRRLAPVASELATIRRVVELRRRGGTLREVARMVAEDGDAMHPQTVARIASYARPGGMYERLGVRFTA